MASRIIQRHACDPSDASGRWLRRSRRPGFGRLTRRLRGVAIGLLVLVPACDDAKAPVERAEASAPAAEAGAQRWDSLTEQGLYRVSLGPESGQARLGPIHDWRIGVETPDGQPVDPSRLAFSGGMPQHGHGFPTAPRVTSRLADGEYRVEGVRFHMSGSWTIRVDVVGRAGPDVAVFEVQVAP